MQELDFFEEMEGSLGGYLIDVELTEDDYQRAFRQAKRMYQQKGNDNYRQVLLPLSLVTGTKTYQLPTNINEIEKVIKRSLYHTDDPFTLASINDLFNSIRGATPDFGSYELLMQGMDDLDIFMANDPQFHFDRIRKTITFMETPKIDEDAILLAYEGLTDDEYRDVPWIYEWTLAELKITLGRAYSKFSTLSAPTGETSLNGDILIQEGREDKERLLLDIQRHVDGAPTGMPILIG